MELLLRNGSELNSTDVRDNTAVHHAAICGSDTILTWLLDVSLNVCLGRDQGVHIVLETWKSIGNLKKKVMELFY